MENCQKLENCLSQKNQKAKKHLSLKNLAKLRKKLSKIRNLTNFDAIEIGSKFLVFDARTALNCLWLAFIKAPILQHFDPECDI